MPPPPATLTTPLLPFPLHEPPTSYARRQWQLADTPHLLYNALGKWDQALMRLDDHYNFLSDPWQWVTHIDDHSQVRGSSLL